MMGAAPHRHGAHRCRAPARVVLGDRRDLLVSEQGPSRHQGPVPVGFASTGWPSVTVAAGVATDSFPVISVHSVAPCFLYALSWVTLPSPRRGWTVTRTALPFSTRYI